MSDVNAAPAPVPAPKKRNLLARIVEKAEALVAAHPRIAVGVVFGLGFALGLRF